MKIKRKMIEKFFKNLNKAIAAFILICVLFLILAGIILFGLQLIEHFHH